MIVRHEERSFGTIALGRDEAQDDRVVGWPERKRRFLGLQNSKGRKATRLEDKGGQQRKATSDADPSTPSRWGAMRLRMTGLSGGANGSGGSWVCIAKEQPGVKATAARGQREVAAQGNIRCRSFDTIALGRDEAQDDRVVGWPERKRR